MTLGITVLLGGTGVTALYFGGKDLIMESGESAIGGACTDIQTMVVKTPSNHLWLRKYIRMEKTSGHDRVRTALRIAGLLAQKHAVDLIHVSVLDAHGPDKRAQMRARAIGAEVLIALKPENLPEMKSPAMASYYEGPVSDEGRYYGDRVVLDIGEIGAMMTAMRTVAEKPDCVNPNAAAQEEAARKAAEHKKKDHKPPANAAKNDGHDPQPDAADSSHAGQETEDAEAKSAPSMLDSLLAMIGLGGDTAESPKTVEVADEPVADAPPAGH